MDNRVSQAANFFLSSYSSCIIDGRESKYFFARVCWSNARKKCFSCVKKGVLVDRILTCSGGEMKWRGAKLDRKLKKKIPQLHLAQEEMDNCVRRSHNSCKEWLKSQLVLKGVIYCRLGHSGVTTSRSSWTNATADKFRLLSSAAEYLPLSRK